MSEQKNEDIIAQTVTTKDNITTNETENKSDLETLNNASNLLYDKDQQLNETQIQNNEMKDKIIKLEYELGVRTEERENYKNKIDGLENEISQLKKQPNTLTPAQHNEVEKIKRQSENMLTKAKGIIFDKTKICKNQELQIEALNQQVASLKEVLSITKSLLEIRNVEVTHLQEKLECMDMKISAEKQRQDLLHKKMEAMSELNDTLKEEYQKQLVLFNEMRNSYEKDQ